ncbi:P-loop containing nucleoside triphosphate hydrolase protein [Amanita muscaria]
MPRNCRNVLAYGSCSDPSCKFNHTILTCEPCGFVASSASFYQSHLHGRKHLSRLAGTTVTVFCPVCQKNIGNGGWESHVRGRPHCNEANRQGVSPNVTPQQGVSSETEKYCDMCRITIRSYNWQRHVAGLQHRKREGYASYKTALDEAEKDKNGLMTEGDFDFGIVEPHLARSGVRCAAKIRLTTPTTRIAMVSYQLVSSKDQKEGADHVFDVTVEGANRNITTITPVTIQVAFKQKHVGRCEDRLEMVFEDVQLAKRFLISKSLSAIVGNKADHEALKAKAPYVPQPRTSREPENDVVEGVQPPATKAVPYVDRLPHAYIPSPLLSTLSSGTTGDIVARVRRTFLPREFSSETYARFFKHLLWIEEYRSDRDLERYDIASTRLSAHRPYYYLDVPGLAEKRPSVLIGDRILVRHSDAARGHWYAGGVHVVRQREVGLRFHESFPWRPTQTYTVRFKLNRLIMRRQHMAMDTAFSQDRVLFPEAHHVRSQSGGGAIKTINPLIQKNALQLKAVTGIVNSPPGSVPFVVFGPPGTGKTITIIEAILQILTKNPKARILACAPSNSAADIILSRLSVRLNTDELFRFYAPSRSKTQVTSDMLEYTHVRDVDGCFSVPPIARMKRFRVIVTTCLSATVVAGIGIPRGHYTHIFIDEAGQATEPEAFVSIKTVADSSTNVVLSGDPKQLGPIIRSTVARVLGLEKSYIERLMERDIYDVQGEHGLTIVKLVQNYRSHEAILKFPNERFYGGDLRRWADRTVTDAFLGSPLLPSKKFPIVFHSVTGRDERESTSPSFFNIDEAIQVKAYVQALRANGRLRTTESEIGVITPYNAQCFKIRAALRGVADEIKVGSVEEFQGQERKVIIISTVRSSQEFVEYDLRHTLGFVASPRRFNVAITRAKALLIIVGDPNVLSLDPLWRSFLNYVFINGGWTGPAPSWDTDEPVDEQGGYDKRVRERAELDMNDFARRIEKLTLEKIDDEDHDANVDRPWRDVE